MKVRIDVAARDQFVHQRLERVTLAPGVKRPPAVVARLASFVQHDPTEQILAAAVGNEGVAFDIQEDVADAGRRKAGKARASLDGQDVVETWCRLAA